MASRSCSAKVSIHQTSAERTPTGRRLSYRADVAADTDCALVDYRVQVNDATGDDPARDIGVVGMAVARHGYGAVTDQLSDVSLSLDPRWEAVAVRCKPCEMASTAAELSLVFRHRFPEGTDASTIFQGQCSFAEKLTPEERAVFDGMLLVSGLPDPCGR